MITAGAYIDMQHAFTFRRLMKYNYENLQELKQILQESPEYQPADLDDFRRAADTVRMAQLGVMLAVADYGDANWSGESTALIGWNGSGCRANNVKYWKDYITHGRDTGRASLFVPTLPSIPVCEAAITMKITGPVLYLGTPPGHKHLNEYLEDLFAAEPYLKVAFVAEIFEEAAVIFAIDKENLKQ